MNEIIDKSNLKIYNDQVDTNVGSLYINIYNLYIMNYKHIIHNLNYEYIHTL